LGPRGVIERSGVSGLAREEKLERGDPEVSFLRRDGKQTEKGAPNIFGLVGRGGKVGRGKKGKILIGKESTGLIERRRKTEMA